MPAATLSVDYGTRIALAQASHLNSLGNNAAKALGKVDNNSARALDFAIDFQATLNSSGVSPTGYIDLYLLVSPDDSANSYTDGIDPAGSADVAAARRNALLIQAMKADADGQVVRDRFTLSLSTAPAYLGFVALNKTGAPLASSGNDVGVTPITYDLG